MQVYQDRLARLIKRALAAGATRRSITQVEWDISGKCLSSKVIELTSRPAEVRHAHTIDWNQPIGRELLEGSVKRVDIGGYRQDGSRKMTQIPLGLTMHVRCRKCENCLRQRQALWAARARIETAQAARTWFGTVTATPDNQILFEYRAQALKERRGVRWSDMSEAERFVAVARVFGAELQKYIKRLRKQSGAPLRYLLVAEAHKTGLPHWHILVHEQDDMKPIRHKLLTEQWTFGFTNWKLVGEDARQASYLCKYLGKDAKARVRASFEYGTRPLVLVKEGTPNATTEKPTTLLDRAGALGLDDVN